MLRKKTFILQIWFENLKDTPILKKTTTMIDLKI